MSRKVHLFEHPRRFLAGAVGEPGARTFFLQAADGARLVSVVLEKQQVALLAERIEQLIAEVAARTGAPPPDNSGEVEALALEEPLTEQFRVGAMALAWDAAADVVIIEAQAPAASEEAAQAALLADVDEGPEALRVRLDPAEAWAFAERARAVVAAGRPLCPLCAQSLDASGHICPRQNGYHRPTEA
ncbi:MAG: DUF3090 family protein [Actinomycetia bacterium]|nr:DUF3090 family protein [Actinomycetes bacterium]